MLKFPLLHSNILTLIFKQNELNSAIIENRSYNIELFCRRVQCLFCFEEAVFSAVRAAFVGACELDGVKIGTDVSEFAVVFKLVLNFV
jgi:hypothetical protein